MIHGRPHFIPKTIDLAGVYRKPERKAEAFNLRDRNSAHVHYNSSGIKWNSQSNYINKRKI